MKSARVIAIAATLAAATLIGAGGAMLTADSARADIVTSRVHATCDKGVLTIKMPEPVLWVTMSFADVMRVCTVPA